MSDAPISRSAMERQEAPQAPPLSNKACGRQRIERSEMSGAPISRSEMSGAPISRSEMGAGDRSRTGYLNLGKVALYQVSYARANYRF